MMRTFVPHGAADEVPAGWGVRRADRMAFPGPAALAADPVHTERLRVYLTDLLRPYGLALDEAAMARGGQSYAEMSEALIARTVPPGESVDLLVLAYAVPDIAPGRATTTRLSHVCPGAPMAFAVTDQGTTAAFTALRLIRAYAAGAGLSRALLLIAEQPSLPYAPALPAGLPATARAVSLLLGPTAPSDPALALAAVATAPGAAAHLPGGAGRDPGPAAQVRAALAAAPGPLTAILGRGLVPAAFPDAHRVRTAAAGRPTTGVWWELAGEVMALQDPRESAPRAAAVTPSLVVADRDAVSGALSTAVFTPSAQAAVAGRQR